MDAPVCSSIFMEARDATSLLLGPAVLYLRSSAMVLGRFQQEMFLILFCIMF